MSRVKVLVEKTKKSKDGRNKAVSKAGEIVNALLAPASQVANLLNTLGSIYPPCSIAGGVLQVSGEYTSNLVKLILSDLLGNRRS